MRLARLEELAQSLPLFGRVMTEIFALCFFLEVLILFPYVVYDPLQYPDPCGLRFITLDCEC